MCCEIACKRHCCTAFNLLGPVTDRRRSWHQRLNEVQPVCPARWAMERSRSQRFMPLLKFLQWVASGTRRPQPSLAWVA